MTMWPGSDAGWAIADPDAGRDPDNEASPAVTICLAQCGVGSGQ